MPLNASTHAATRNSMKTHPIRLISLLLVFAGSIVSRPPAAEIWARSTKPAGAMPVKASIVASIRSASVCGGGTSAVELLGTGWLLSRGSAAIPNNMDSISNFRDIVKRDASHPSISGRHGMWASTRASGPRHGIS